MIIAQQKCGSTLLCYIASLINVNNNINVFRNDFDLLPMLSFPTSIFPQNFNARQVGSRENWGRAPGVSARQSTHHSCSPIAQRPHSQQQQRPPHLNTATHNSRTSTTRPPTALPGETRTTTCGRRSDSAVVPSCVWAGRMKQGSSHAGGTDTASWPGAGEGIRRYGDLGAGRCI